MALAQLYGMTDCESSVMGNEDRYLDLINFKSAKEIYERIDDLPDESDEFEHLVRYLIFDLHAATEIEFRRILYHTFRHQLFLTNDRNHNDSMEKELSNMISSLGFMEVFRILRPILLSWPYEDFASIHEIDATRNQTAHAGRVEEVTYKGRNPFSDPDCLSQMYFDVWGMKQCFARHFENVIERPRVVLQRYIEKHGRDA